MRCLILGASGQVGAQLMAACDDRGLIPFGTSYLRTASPHRALDLRDDEALDRVFDDFEPDVTFLPAAATHMDRAETHPDDCLAINVGGPRAVAERVARTGGRLVFFSTDHVFAECPRAMKENDAIRPQSVYAKSKAAAEQAIRLILPQRHLILRTSWVYGPDDAEKNFACATVQRLRRGEMITVANDQFGQPTYGPDLADVALELTMKETHGTVHVVGPDRHSKFTFARLIAHVFGLDCDLVRGVPSAELRQAAPRPKNVWLAGTKLRSLLGPHAVRRPGNGLRELRDVFLAPAVPVWA
jgi:dTDP-4-dehydrorhamnose reductase